SNGSASMRATRCEGRRGHDRFDAVFATKQRGTISTIAIAPSVSDPDRGPAQMRVRTTASAQTTAWKQQPAGRVFRDG
ncbi:MAG TPA: hypothetical protein VIP09_14140, partial [Dehalococcoidia bacterium]